MTRDIFLELPLAWHERLLDAVQGDERRPAQRLLEELRRSAAPAQRMPSVTTVIGSIASPRWRQYLTAVPDDGGGGLGRLVHQLLHTLDVIERQPPGGWRVHHEVLWFDDDGARCTGQLIDNPWCEATHVDGSGPEKT